MKEWIGKQASKVGSVKEFSAALRIFWERMIMVLKVLYGYWGMIQLYYSKDCLLFWSVNRWIFILRCHIVRLILYIWSSVASQQFKMEEVIFRFPQLAERIFQNLDSKSCVKCTLVGRKWKTFLEKENFYFFKIVKAFTKCTTKSLKKIHSHSSLSSIS